MPVTSSNLSGDTGKFVQDKLIARSEQLHKLPQMCNPITLPTGMAKTATMVKYNRTDVPVDKLVEGTTPSETPFTITTQTVTVEEWGLFIALTNVGVLTTKHAVLNEAINLVADAIARCEDYGIAEVIQDGTNKQFWDGTRANRAAITSTDVFKAAVAHKARVDLGDKGAPERTAGLYVAITGPQVMGDILAETAAVGSFTAGHQTTKQEKLEKGVVGDWLGFRWIQSNFLPKFTRISTFSAPTATTGGSLSGTVFHKVTRKSLARGFEEDIQVEASTAMAGNTRLVFTAPSTAGFVYNIYAGSSSGDANLFLAKENLAASGVFNLDTLPTSGQTPPETPAASITVHPIYVFAADCIDWVELSGSSMQAAITPRGISDSDPLGQRRKVGAKYMAKSGIRDNDRMKTIELVSNF